MNAINIWTAPPYPGSTAANRLPSSGTYPFYPIWLIFHLNRDLAVLRAFPVSGVFMDFGQLLGDAFAYTQEGILGNANRWLKLILAVILLGLPFNGYVMRIYRGTTAAPEVDEWGTLFVDGLKLLVVGLIYAIPLLILWVLIYGSMFLALANGKFEDAAMTSFTPNLALMLLFYIVEIIVAIIMPVAAIRFARTHSFGEAFNFGAILETIGKIGWINYIIALILVSIVIGIPIAVIVFGLIIIAGATVFLLNGGLAALLGFVALGVLIILILAPLFGVFQARYMTRLYESAGPAS
jgi:hypothetical protein